MPRNFTDVEPPKVSFWEDNKYPELVDILNEDIPAAGEVTDKNRPMLEDWRVLSNAYYRCYNDGDAFVRKLHKMAERHNTEIKDSGKSLENLADIIFKKALIEKYNSLNGLNSLKVNEIGALIMQKLSYSEVV